MNIPEDFPVRPLGPAETAAAWTTCGHCHLSWDDAIPTAYTPAPAGRCPFEAFHEEPDQPAWTDQGVVDAIATYLGTSAEWSGADALEVIADLIGKVRPHPGDEPAEIYAQSFRNFTGRWINENYDMEGQ